MSEENITQEFRLKNIDETRNYFIEEINQNEWMTKNYINVCGVSNYIAHSFILVSTVTRWISITSLFLRLAFPEVLGVLQPG